MKEGIHPKYGKVTVHCACGNSIVTQSTVQGTIQVDICSLCHPFFTGKQKLIDTAGRIDRFKKKFGDKVAVTVKKKKALPPAKPVKIKEEDKDAAKGRKAIKDTLATQLKERKPAAS